MARRLYDSRAREIAIQTALLARLEAAAAQRLARVLMQTYNDSATGVEIIGANAIDNAVALNSDQLERILKGDYIASAELFAKRLEQRVKGFYPKYRKDFELTFDQQLQMFVTKWTAERVVLIDRTTRDQIKVITRNGLESGKTNREIATDIRNAAPYMSRTRAAVIARTETHTAANAGAQFEANTSEFELQKEWMSVNDQRTRETPPDEFDHVEADRQVVKSTESFDVSGEELDYPGDPTGSPGNIINCRCCRGDIVV